jgi:metal-sulfur cluster biosynthetic enzyme
MNDQGNIKSSPLAPPQAAPTPTPFTVDDVYKRLDTVIDPELGISIVKLGLIYKVAVGLTEDRPGKMVKITMTLTTPGCPLAGVFDGMVKDSLFGLPGLNPDRDVWVELTFDPPWVPDMMDEEAKAELGF